MLKNNFKNKKVIFAGCAKNCEKYLLKTLENIEFYSLLFKESYQIIIENGSSDKTREILNSNKKSNCYYLFEDQLEEFDNRVLRLENARNIIIDKIKSDPKLIDCDLLILMDFDDIGNYQIKHENIIKSLEFLFSKNSIAGVFANQLGTYYDMWALRDEKYCKNDFWVEVLQKICLKILPHEQLTQLICDEIKKEYIDNKTYSFNETLEPIKVNSAFGGFGIYKIINVLKNKKKYKGSQFIDLKFKDNTTKKINFQRCEHVNFNLGLVEQGYELYILPYLINRKFKRITFPPQVVVNFIIKN